MERSIEASKERKAREVQAQRARKTELLAAVGLAVATVGHIAPHTNDLDDFTGVVTQRLERPAEPAFSCGGHCAVFKLCRPGL